MNPKKLKEIILYLIFGVLTTIISIGCFYICNSAFSLNEHISNIISWIVAVTFAYLTNRKWVFSSGATGTSNIIKELLSFFASRLTTLGIEEVIILIFVTLMHFNGTLVKTCAQVVVIVLNYVFSKLLVFKESLSQED